MYSILLSDLAKQLDAHLYGDGTLIITGIASIEKSHIGQITVLHNNRLRNKLSSCQASAVILTEENLPFNTCCPAALVVNNPYLAYAHIAQLMDTTPKPAYEIHANAIISPKAIIQQGVTIGAHTVIESGVVLENNVSIGPGCFIGKNTYIGSGTYLWAHVVIYHEIIIGAHCLIHSGTVIGADGFGYANDDAGNWIKIPQLGRVIIGDQVEIGSCTTIDRGTLDDTCIGNGVIIDNQCQIAHNVKIGNNTAIAGGVIMAGSLIVGKQCLIGGSSVINGHISICDKVTITGMSMVITSITKPGIYSSGIPSQPNKKWRKTAVLVMNINDIYKRIKTIERNLKKNNYSHIIK